ncbi:MAG TPA: DUF4097 family beta strand repeat-containing protein [Terriglobales bacterium]|nr:DUF4097 family beta strand repeat-containing protein [Terriglobales bacterium]
MKNLLIASLALTSALALTAGAQVTEHTYTLGSSPRITVDNVNGPIRVIGDGGSQVRFTATESNPDNVADVHLEVTPSSDGLELYVDGPFRHRHGWFDDDRYNRVKFSFELHVPAHASLDVKTVNDGAVQLDRMAGEYQAHNVNGDVNLTNESGSGRATTVNGAIHAAFSSNPAQDSDFTTVNGDVSVYLQPSLNAGIKYTTVNGDVYTDYQMDLQRSGSQAGEHMIVYSRRRSSGGQIGQGGPLLSFRTVNGSIYIHKAKP